MGSYVEGNLLPDEQIRYSAKLHWMMYVPHVILMFVLVGFVTILIPLIRQWTTEIVATNKRVIGKEGLISRRTLEMNLVKVETIGVDQGIIGRIFDFGTIVVVGTGGTREAFKWIEKPLEFRRTVQEMIG